MAGLRVFGRVRTTTPVFGFLMPPRLSLSLIFVYLGGPGRSGATAKLEPYRKLGLRLKSIDPNDAYPGKVLVAPDTKRRKGPGHSPRPLSPNSGLPAGGRRQAGRP